MEGDETTFPMDVTDPTSRPWKFRAEGYLVAILADTEEGQRAQSALVEAGFAPHDIKLYTGEEILKNHEEYLGRRGIVSKAVGAVTDDEEGRELYLGYARAGRSAAWVRIPDAADVRKALSALAEFEYLHTRYYGADGLQDFHVS